jgi:fluoride ion exporter CrcB/FEX
VSGFFSNVIGTFILGFMVASPLTEITLPGLYTGESSQLFWELKAIFVLCAHALNSTPTAWRNDAITAGITTGFCGAYTTFSAWTVRTDELIVSQQPKALSQQPQIAGIMYVAGGIAVFFASRTVGADLGALVPATGVTSLQKRCTEVSMAYAIMFNALV